MKNGLYSVSFNTPVGAGNGVIVANDGQFRGGDSALYYTGEYTVNGDAVSIVLSTGRHANNGMGSVFGADSVNVNLTGQSKGDTVQVNGSHGPIEFSATLKFICN